MLVFRVARLANVLALGFCPFILASGPNLSYGQIRPVRFIPLGDAAGGEFNSYAAAVSADGRVVVGTGRNAQGTVALHWTEQGGITEIPPAHPEKRYRSTAQDVSSDGRTVVGESSSAESFRGVNMPQGYVWTAESGIRLLGSLPGVFPSSAARAISGDGTIVGGQVSAKVHGVGGGFGFAWTQSEGLNILPASSTIVPRDVRGISSDGTAAVGVGFEYTEDGPLRFSNGKRGRRTAFQAFNTGELQAMGVLPGHLSSMAMDVSHQGRYVVGSSEKKGGAEAYIWDAARGIRGLGHLQRHEVSFANGISDDGRIVVGVSGKEDRRAFIWTQDTGMRDLQSLAVDAGLDLNDWVLKVASDVSADGRTIVGSGTNPQGKREGWILRLTVEAN